MNEDVLYTPDEIAQKLRITKYTVYEMIKRGDLDAHRIGKHIRISDTQYSLYLLRSKGSENNYEAIVAFEGDETVAKIGSASIRVNTDLTGSVRVTIRPEDVILSTGSFVSSARNIHKGVVTEIIIVGSGAKVVLDIGIPLIALITLKSLNEMNIKKGSSLYAIFKTMAVNVYK